MEIPKAFQKKIWRAFVEFSQLDPGDKVLIGYSGGKDSLFLALVLSQLREKLPFPLELAAVHIDLGFGLDLSPHQDFFQKQNLKLEIVSTQISTLLTKPNPQNPCSRCAYFRRGALKKYALAENYTKIALAHHHDDAVETLLLSMIYSGQIKTLGPTSYWDRAGLTLIRPLIYLREHEIASFTKQLPIAPIQNLCPFDGASKRAEIKKLIQTLETENPTTYSNLASCLRSGKAQSLWPPSLTKKELNDAFANFSNQSPKKTLP